MTNNQLKLIKLVLLFYTIHTIKETDKRFHKELWYKQALKVGKFFKKRKPEPVNVIDGRYLTLKQEQIREMDLEFFKDRKCSSYIIMFEILNYLMYVIEDEEFIKEFKDVPFNQVQKELQGMEVLKEVRISSNLYLTAVLELVGVEV